jgi:hypothetical protein
MVNPHYIPYKLLWYISNKFIQVALGLKGILHILIPKRKFSAFYTYDRIITVTCSYNHVLQIIFDPLLL